MTDYDLIVVGAGPAGIVSALSARREGAGRVLLIDENNMPGGMISNARVHSMLTFHGLQGHKIIGGLPELFISRMKQSALAIGHVRDCVGVAKSITPVSPAGFAVTSAFLCEEYGVEMMMGSRVISTEWRDLGCGLKEIMGIKCVRGNEEHFISAPLYIDSAGGSLAILSEASLLPADKSGLMPMTLIFSLSNIDLTEVKRYMYENRSEFHYQTLWNELKGSSCLGVSGFFSLWEQAELSIPRDRVLFYQTLGKNEVSVNSTRVFSPSEPEGILPYDSAIKQVGELFAFMKKELPGFKNSFISDIAPVIGVREGARVKGHYILTGDDVKQGRRFDDEIAFSGFPIDIHSPSGNGIVSVDLGGDGFCGIPYRSIISYDIINLLIPGKALSAEFEAHASVRVQASSMAMGEAAGSAAAICIAEKKVPSEVGISELRTRLSQKGVILEPEPDHHFCS